MAGLNPAIHAVTPAGSLLIWVEEMEIQRLAGVSQLLVSEREFVALHSCLNEVCNLPLIKDDGDFERWIGVKRDSVGTLFSLFPENRWHGTVWGSGESGLLIKVGHDGGFRIELSDANLRVVRNCLYETCNWIRLYEFQTRIGIELEDALAMLRLMTNAIKLAN